MNYTLHYSFTYFMFFYIQISHVSVITFTHLNLRHITSLLLCRFLQKNLHWPSSDHHTYIHIPFGFWIQFWFPFMYLMLKPIKDYNSKYHMGLHIGFPSTLNSFYQSLFLTVKEGLQKKLWTYQLTSCRLPNFHYLDRVCDV